ncbi:MAG: single-stranded-DNA-specific exonuclease RecJ [Candidatus Korobacteraceae bacterium]
MAQALQLPPAVATLLASRGICDAEEAGRFLNPSLADLHSPYLMLDMRAAVERVSLAIARSERVLVYGDYDVDGTMATVILKTAIELCGGQCEFHVPHRLLEGYDLRDEVIERAAVDGIRLIISVDTGIRAFAAAETARRLNLDLIVTDHHLPQVGKGLPKALAVLNPNRADCRYPDKGLCGAGVAFKLAQALLEINGRSRLVPSFLKVVAIATIADAVPLTGENRIFASLGLHELRHPVNPGLRALLEVANIETGRPLTATEVAFRIAPRMNAAGRMDIARNVVDLFTEKVPARALEIAKNLDRLNGDRQQEEARILEAIASQLEESPEFAEAICLVLDGEGWHRGVIGICASRLVDRYRRPAVVISRNGEEAHGSGRSISGFHMLAALEQCSELFTRFGGHAHAVGFALRSERVPELRRRLNCFAAEHLRPEDLEPALEYDLELPLHEIGSQLWDALCRLEPFGAGNPQPVFIARKVRSLAPAKILKGKHLKLKLARGVDSSSGLARGIEGLGWGMAGQFEGKPFEAGQSLDVAFTIERNNHQDFGGHLQLNLRDWLCSD